MHLINWLLLCFIVKQNMFVQFENNIICICKVVLTQMDILHCKNEQKRLRNETPQKKNLQVLNTSMLTIPSTNDFDKVATGIMCHLMNMAATCFNNKVLTFAELGANANISGKTTKYYRFSNVAMQ